MADTSPQTKREQRLDRLKAAVHGYVLKEKERIDTQVLVLQAIQAGRRAGSGAATDATTAVSKIVESSLAAFLQGD